jgi:hypothetical protein
MATKSFIKEFSVNKNNAWNVVRALQQPKKITLIMSQRVNEANKETIHKFFGSDE